MIAVLPPKTARYAQACQYRTVPAGRKISSAMASIMTPRPSVARPIMAGDSCLSRMALIRR